MDIKNILSNIKPLRPDREKILYYSFLTRQGKTSLVKGEEMLGMFKYILENNEIKEYSSEVSKLSYIIQKLYNVNTYSILQRGV